MPRAEATNKAMIAKEPRKEKQEMRQSYAEYGMRMSGVTVEKFDGEAALCVILLQVEKLVLIHHPVCFNSYLRSRDVGLVFSPRGSG